MAGPADFTLSVRAAVDRRDYAAPLNTNKYRFELTPVFSKSSYYFTIEGVVEDSTEGSAGCVYESDSEGVVSAGLLPSEAVSSFD